MDSQHLPLQLFLLFLAVAHELDAHSGTTVTPWQANVSEAASNMSALDREDKNMTSAMAVVFFDAGPFHLFFPSSNSSTTSNTLVLSSSRAWQPVSSISNSLRSNSPSAISGYEAYAELCWNIFAHQMAIVNHAKWCHWRAIRRPYRNLRYCLEKSAEILNYGYPNALAEEYTVFSHYIYFFNCTLEQQLLLDPPENVLLTLILTPICLIPFLVTLVVWKSKGEMQS